MEHVNATGASPVIDVEAPDAERTLHERLMMGIRIDEGVPIDDVRTAARALNCEASLLLAAAQLTRDGMLEDDADAWRLTERGFLFADGVASELMSAVSQP
jgi:coproporphyrinogen III oxidase-like Fe-S oxidoreductase